MFVSKELFVILNCDCSCNSEIAVLCIWNWKYKIPNVIYKWFPISIRFELKEAVSSDRIRRVNMAEPTNTMIISFRFLTIFVSVLIKCLAKTEFRNSEIFYYAPVCNRTESIAIFSQWVYYRALALHSIYIRNLLNNLKKKKIWHT